MQRQKTNWKRMGSPLTDSIKTKKSTILKTESSSKFQRNRLSPQASFLLHTQHDRPSHHNVQGEHIQSYNATRRNRATNSQVVQFLEEFDSGNQSNCPIKTTGSGRKGLHIRIGTETPNSLRIQEGYQSGSPMMIGIDNISPIKKVPSVEDSGQFGILTLETSPRCRTEGADLSPHSPQRLFNSKTPKLKLKELNRAQKCQMGFRRSYNMHKGQK